MNFSRQSLNTLQGFLATNIRNILFPELGIRYLHHLKLSEDMTIYLIGKTKYCDSVSDDDSLLNHQVNFCLTIGKNFPFIWQQKIEAEVTEGESGYERGDPEEHHEVKQTVLNFIQEENMTERW